ncbi:MAG: CoB--CoM heterodisulfide reductase subunit C [Promethearchaeota archaeon]
MDISETLEKKEYLSSSDLDPTYFNDIARRSNIFSCIQCGTCTSSCESGLWAAIKTRVIIRKVALGDLSVLSDPDIWLCSTCYTCYERCPRDVRPTDVIIELRNYASELGNMHPNHIAVVDNFRKTGHAVPINDKIKKQREELGLAPLPPTIYKFKDAEDSELVELAKLFKVVERGKAQKKKFLESKKE